MICLPDAHIVERTGSQSWPQRTPSSQYLSEPTLLVCESVWMCMCCMCVVCMHVGGYTCGSQGENLSLSLPHSIPLRQSLSLNLDRSWQQVSSSNPLNARSSQCWVIGILFYMGAGDLNSGPHACTASALSQRAISSVLSPCFMLTFVTVILMLIIQIKVFPWVFPEVHNLDHPTTPCPNTSPGLVLYFYVF